VALATGRVVGRFAHRIGGSRRAIVRRNIELCFPELTNQQYNDLTFEHFKALGMMIIEMGLGRWASDKHLASITTINGLEHVQAAVEKGQGIILLAAHFTTLEISGRILALKIPPFDSVYRKNHSEFITELQRTGRERSCDSTFEKRDIKKMVRSLRSGRPVWYAPDQFGSTQPLSQVEIKTTAAPSLLLVTPRLLPTPENSQERSLGMAKI